jgi:hypothetical protein
MHTDLLLCLICLAQRPIPTVSAWPRDLPIRLGQTDLFGPETYRSARPRGLPICLAQRQTDLSCPETYQSTNSLEERPTDLSYQRPTNLSGLETYRSAWPRDLPICLAQDRSVRPRDLPNCLAKKPTDLPGPETYRSMPTWQGGILTCLSERPTDLSGRETY